MNKLDYDIIIIGAGMVGASAALSLARQGFNLLIIEQGQASTFDVNADIELRVSAISPQSESFLSQLGVWPLIQNQRSFPYYNMHVWDENSEGKLDFSAGQNAQPHLGHIIENNLIITSLQQQLSCLENVHILWGNTVTDINQNENFVEINTTSNPSIKAQLLIAADGRNSKVREQLNIGLVSKSYQQKAIVSNVYTEKSHNHTAWQRFLSTGPLAFLPLNDKHSSIVWSTQTDHADTLMQLSDEEFSQQLNQAFDHKLGPITSCSKRAAFPLNWQYAEDFVQGRCILIGDAAHGIHPLAGQGVNLGFADAQLLSELLKPSKLNKINKLLRKFERQRKHDCLIMLHSMSAINQMFGATSYFGPQLRGVGMNIINSSETIKALLTQDAGVI